MATQTNIHVTPHIAVQASECRDGAGEADKTIILLGKTGVGKSTIARHIFKHDSDRFRTYGGAVNSMTREAKYYTGVHSFYLTDDNGPCCVNVRVIILDTNSLHGQKYNISQLSNVKKVSAIFFVLKHGRVTKEDCKPFTEIIHSFRDHGILEVCHLLITCCEGEDAEGRDVIVEMYRSDPMTQELCYGVNQIKCVGFPDIDRMKLVMRDIYAEEIKKDEDMLQSIIETSVKSQHSISVIDFNSTAFSQNREGLTVHTILKHLQCLIL
jgi:GTPase SAR1 family protein